MDNYSYVRENYKKAVNSLTLGVKECREKPTDLMIDGLIHRFELSTDFALKACGEYLDTAGHRIEGAPKVVLTKAHTIRLIDDVDLWFAIIADRNTTSQIYDKIAARRVAENVRNIYLPHFIALAKRFS